MRCSSHKPRPVCPSSSACAGSRAAASSTSLLLSAHHSPVVAIAASDFTPGFDVERRGASQSIFFHLEGLSELKGYSITLRVNLFLLTLPSEYLRPLSVTLLCPVG